MPYFTSHPRFKNKLPRVIISYSTCYSKGKKNIHTCNIKKKYLEFETFIRFIYVTQKKKMPEGKSKKRIQKNILHLIMTASATHFIKIGLQLFFISGRKQLNLNEMMT